MPAPHIFLLDQEQICSFAQGVAWGETGRKQLKESSQKDNGDSIRENGVEGYGGNS